MKRSAISLGVGVFIFGTSMWTGCKMAPMQVIPQPREVKYGLSEMPKVPPPNAAAAEVPAGFGAEVVVSGLTYPSSVEFDN